MVIDLFRFDWTAVAAIGQVTAATATLFSLWLLWRQVLLMKHQLDQSQAQLRLAAEQIAEATAQSERARHEAVIPELVIDDISVRVCGHNRVEISADISNVGVGPAHRLMFAHYLPTGALGFGVRYATALGPEGKMTITTEAPMPFEGQLALSWANRYQSPFERRWTISGDALALRLAENPTRNSQSAWATLNLDVPVYRP